MLYCAVYSFSGGIESNLVVYCSSPQCLKIFFFLSSHWQKVDPLVRKSCTEYVVLGLNKSQTLSAIRQREFHSNSLTVIISNFSASHTNCWTTLNTKLDCTFFQVFRVSSKACIFSSGHGLCVPVLFIHKHLVKAYIFFFWRCSNKNTPVFQPTVTLH